MKGPDRSGLFTVNPALTLIGKVNAVLPRR